MRRFLSSLVILVALVFGAGMIHEAKAVEETKPAATGQVKASKKTPKRRIFHRASKKTGESSKPANSAGK